MILFEGVNGAGKSNLIEALYLLAIAKSLRASTDRELVRWQPAAEEAHAQVAAAVQRDSGRLRVQVDFRSTSTSDANDAGEGDAGRIVPATSVQKYVRVNGVPRRTSDLVGELNAVMFSAQDLQLVLGSPSVRRRYLDILISQLDRHYLRTVQRYHRIIEQRNHLLKAVRDRRSNADELGFWDDRLVEAGTYIMARRADTVGLLSGRATELYGELSGDGHTLELAYGPSVETAPEVTAEELSGSLSRALVEARPREIAQGHTTCGPHRDDVSVTLRGMDAGLYASRGQCRTIVLAMKLAEAAILKEERGQGPVLLLDDLLSELDPLRRSRVLDHASRYQQSFITTADTGLIDDRFLSRMARFEVREGTVQRS
jgi:DNA replication and repair protein RecF